MAQQPKEVMAFRARLLRWGYTDVSICRAENNLYYIQATEPLARQRIVFYSSPAVLGGLMRKSVVNKQRKER